VPLDYCQQHSLPFAKAVRHGDHRLKCSQRTLNAAFRSRCRKIRLLISAHRKRAPGIYQARVRPSDGDILLDAQSLGRHRRISSAIRRLSPLFRRRNRAGF
jgi:hypothetical protein